MKNTENRDGHYYTPLLWKQAAGTEMHSAIVSGNDIAREASDSYCPFFFFPFLVTVPEAFAKLTRSSFLLGSKVANWAVVGRGQC